MTRSSRRRRGRAAIFQEAAAADADAAFARLLENNLQATTATPNDPLPPSEMYEILQTDRDNHSSIHNISINYLLEQERELIQALGVYDVLLADPYLPETELNDVLAQQAECFHQWELFYQQHEEEFGLRELSQQLQEEFHHDALEAYHRDIEQFETTGGNSYSAATALPERSYVARPVIASTNRNLSFKGHILNPNQDETDESSNTSSTHRSSPGSSTTILSADFGDDDVVPIEESSCVICCVDYRHGDEIVRNANSCNGSNSSAGDGRNHQQNRINRVSAVSCNHVFHTKCITSWIESSRKSDCPCCRSPFALLAPMK